MGPNELSGHGDPLLMAAMKEVLDERVEKYYIEETASCVVSHSDATQGYGDPLFQAVQAHDSSPAKALHEEFLGHGDPLMEEVLEEWEKEEDLKVVHKENLHKVDHTDVGKKHGDPLWKDFVGTLGKEGDKMKVQ